MPGEERKEGNPGEEVTDENGYERETLSSSSKVPLFIDRLERFEKGEDEGV